MKENAIIIASIGCLTSFFVTTIQCLAVGCIIAGIILLTCTCRLVSLAKKYLLPKSSKIEADEFHKKSRELSNKSLNNKLVAKEQSKGVNGVVEKYKKILNDKSSQQVDSDKIEITRAKLEMLLGCLN